jgi:hypothetical protein
MEHAEKSQARLKSEPRMQSTNHAGSAKRVLGLTPWRHAPKAKDGALSSMNGKNKMGTLSWHADTRGNKMKQPAGNCWPSVEAKNRRKQRHSKRST